MKASFRSKHYCILSLSNIWKHESGESTRSLSRIPRLPRSTQGNLPAASPPADVATPPSDMLTYITQTRSPPDSNLMDRSNSSSRNMNYLDSNSSIPQIPASASDSNSLVAFGDASPSRPDEAMARHITTDSSFDV